MFASKAIGGRPVKWVESRRESYGQHDPRPRPHHLPRDRRQARRRGHRAPGQDAAPTSAAASRRSAPASRRRSTPASCRAATRSRTSTPRSPASTRTRRSSTPTAAPAGPRRPTSSSGRWTSSPTRSGWTGPSVRRRNFIPPDQFPYENPSGLGTAVGGAKIYIDSGNYEPAMDKALATAGYDDLAQPRRPRRRAAASSSGWASAPTSRSAASPRPSGSARSARAGAPRCGSRRTSRST